MMTTTWKDGTRTTARLVGIFFITGTAAGILSAVRTGPLFDGPGFLAKVSTGEYRLVAGALLVLLMGFALAMVPVLLFPMFRRHDEALALGSVVFRGALEAVMLSPS